MPIGTRNSSLRSSPGVTGGSKSDAVSSLVIIDDFNIPSHPLSPLKTDPIALIDTDTILTGAIALQRFKTIAWRNAKIIKRSADLQLSNLPQGNPLKRNELPNPRTHCKAFSVFIFI